MACDVLDGGTTVWLCDGGTAAGGPFDFCLEAVPDDRCEAGADGDDTCALPPPPAASMVKRALTASTWPSVPITVPVLVRSVLSAIAVACGIGKTETKKYPSLSLELNIN